MPHVRRIVPSWCAWAAAFAACTNHHAAAPPGPELEVLAFAPAPGATVAVDARVEVVFAEAMDVATLTTDGLRLEDGSGPLPGSHAYDALSRTWTFTPEPPLPLGMPLRAVLTTGVRSESGLRLRQDRQVEFGVVDGALRAPVDLGTTQLGGLHLAAMQDGLALLAHGNQVFEVTGAGLGATARLPGPVASLVFPRSDAAVALCVNSNSLSFRAALTRRAAAGAWSAPVTLVDAQCFLRDIELLGNGRGDLALRWTGLVGLPEQFFEGVLRAPFTSPTFTTIDVGPVSLARQIALDGNGSLFHGLLDESGVQITRVASAGGTLGLPVAGPGAMQSGIACDASGRMLALYRTGNAITGDLRSRRFDPQRGLEREQVCFRQPATVAWFGLGERGDGAAALTVVSGATLELWAMTHSGRSGSWQQAGPILPGIDLDQGGRIAGAVSPRGIAWLACVVPQPSGQQLVLLRAPPGGAFGAAQFVAAATPGGSIEQPAVAADAAGRAVVLWQLRPTPGANSGPLFAARFD